MPLPSIHHLRAYGADDDGRALAFSILFSEGITSVERYWVTSDEHQSWGVRWLCGTDSPPTRPCRTLRSYALR